MNTNGSLADAVMTNISNLTESLPTKPSVKNSNLAFHQLFNYYLMALVLLVGVMANSVIVVVMRDVSFNKLPLSVYFTALAISDTVVLCFTAGFSFLQQATGKSFMHNTVLCSTCGFVINFAGGTSSWFIVCIAFERLLVVKFPFKAKRFTSKTKAVITLTIITIMLILVNSHWIFMIDYTTTTCQYLPVFKDFRKTATLIYAVGMNILPLSVTCVCYFLLVVMVIRKRQVAPHSGGVVKEKLTITALYICLAFMVLTSPFAIYIMLSGKKGWLWNPTEASMIFETLALFLQKFNYSVNFFIYVATSSQFRSKVSKLLKKLI